MFSIEYMRKYEPKIIDSYRQLHMYPETGFEEVKTSEFIQSTLKASGIEVVSNIAKTGVIGILQGAKKGKTIALRADMDALNIHEESDVNYKSKIDGKMHACGHDAHTAMLLGAARILADHKDSLQGTVKFIFQPAEEGPAPGGGTLVMKHSLLTDIEAILALHVTPTYPTGKVAIHNNEAMASTDFFKIVLIGLGGHGAAPHLSVDPIMMAAEVLSAFQNIISRETDALDPVVLSVCSINGGNQFNAIPERVTLTGTVRTLNEETRARIFERMEAIVSHTTAMYRGDYYFERGKGYPPLINHREIVDDIAKLSSFLIGNESVVRLDKPLMGGEDFAYYLKKIPGALLWLGCGNPKKAATAMLHNPKFMLDEEALIIGTAIHVNFVLNKLKLL